MVQGQYISGGGQGIVFSLVRGAMLVLAAIGGFFLFAASAAFALIVAGGLLILGFVVFCGFWLRAKISGKPLMPNMKSYQFQTGQFGSDAFNMRRGGQDSGEAATDSDGPVIDAHQTPDGWSVDRD